MNILILILAIVVLIINIYPILFYKAPITHSNKEKFDVIIVLGYPATKEGKPSPIMRERLNTAAALFKSGYSDFVICTGGSAHNKYIEAEVMEEYLTSLNIPKDKIIKENKSQNTYANLFNSKNIMKNRGFKSAVVVTSPWHLRRANYLMSKFSKDYVMKGSSYPKEFPFIVIILIYAFENYIMMKNKILFH